MAVSVAVGVAVGKGVGVSVRDGATVNVAVGTTGSGEASGVAVVLAGTSGVVVALQEVRMKLAIRLIPVILENNLRLIIIHLLG